MSNRLDLIKPEALILLRKNEYLRSLRNEYPKFNVINYTTCRVSRKHGVPYTEVKPIVEDVFREVKLEELLEI